MEPEMEQKFSELSMDAALGVQISLDSVVQKASELEDILRSCKARVCENTAPGARGGWGSEEAQDEQKSWLAAQFGAESAARELQLQERYTSPKPLPSPPPPQPSSPSVGENGAASSPASAAAITEAWQQLTSYIVGLEKELHHYRKLVEDLQAREVYSQQLAGYLPQSTSGLPMLSIHGAGEERTRMDDWPDTGGLPGGESAGRHQAVAGKEPDSTLGETQEDKQWDQLTEDPECRPLLLVFSYLTTVELCAVSRVCRRWYLVSRHPLLWKRVHIAEVTLHPQALPIISQRCRHTDKITLHGLIPEMAICEEDLQSYIQRMRGSLEDGLTAVLSVCGQNLQSLSITECNLMITERVLWLVSVNCPNLEEFGYCSDEFPPSSESIWSLANGCKHIRRLSCPPFVGSPQADRFNDSCLQIIAHNWPQLTHITVGGKAISPNGVAEVALFCPYLIHLELIHGPHLNSKAVTVICQDGVLQSLETLSLTFTPISPKALLQFIIHCVRLTSLHLNINLHTYFPDSGTEPTQISKYERILRNLKELQQHPRTRGVFHLYEHFN